MIVNIIQGKSDWQFLQKNDDRTCEVLNSKTKEEFEGFVESISTNGTYKVKLTEEIKGTK